MKIVATTHFANTSVVTVSTGAGVVTLVSTADGDDVLVHMDGRHENLWSGGGPSSDFAAAVLRFVSEEV